MADPDELDEINRRIAILRDNLRNLGRELINQPRTSHVGEVAQRDLEHAALKPTAPPE